MKGYKKITVWENGSRIRILKQFRGLVLDYYRLSEDESIKGRSEKLDSRRQEINLHLLKVKICLSDVEIDTGFLVSAVSAQGISQDGQEVDLMDNIFSLERYHVQFQELLDLIDRATGVYLQDRNYSIVRTLNPFFWVNILAGILARIPFYLLSVLGLPQDKIENNFLGRALHGFLRLICMGLILYLLIALFWEDIRYEGATKVIIDSFVFADNIAGNIFGILDNYGF